MKTYILIGLLLASTMIFQQNKNLVKVSGVMASNDGPECDLFVNPKYFNKSGDTLFYEAHYIEQKK